MKGDHHPVAREMEGVSGPKPASTGRRKSLTSSGGHGFIVPTKTSAEFPPACTSFDKSGFVPLLSCFRRRFRRPCRALPL